MATETSDHRINIAPLTRVQGQAKITILRDSEGHILQTRLHALNFRGLEQAIQGRPYWEAPVLMQHLDGGCPVSWHLAATKAMDFVVGAVRIPPTAEKIRCLALYGEMLQAHAFQIYRLAMPDLILYSDMPESRQRFSELALNDQVAARHDALLRTFAQKLMQALSGRTVKGSPAVPGGVIKNLGIPQRDALLEDMSGVMDAARQTLARARSWVDKEPWAALEEEPAACLAMIGGRGILPLNLTKAKGREVVSAQDGPAAGFNLYDGRIAVCDASGQPLVQDTEASSYAELLREEVKPWSFMRFPFIRTLDPDRGWYRVGPLARLNLAVAMGTPEADQALTAFRAYSSDAKTCRPMAWHWARAIELLHAAEVVHRLLQDTDLQGDDLESRGEPRRGDVYGMVESPRGTLIHHYRVNENDQIVYAHVLSPTAQNNTAMNRIAARAAEHFLNGREPAEQFLNGIAATVRVYAPNFG